MNPRSILAAAVILIVVGSCGIAAVSTLSQSLAPVAIDVAGSSGPGMMSGNMDSMFITQMIPHHDDAIAMADLALTRAEHPEIKQLAEDIKRTQTSENAQMRAMYRAWFGADVPTGSVGGMGGPMMGGGATDLGALENAESFDKAFIEQMIPHHEMGIMMSRMAGGATGRPELQALTQSIIDGQTAEIIKMRTWYEEWYGRP